MFTMMINQYTNSFRINDDEEIHEIIIDVFRTSIINHEMIQWFVGEHEEMIMKIISSSLAVTGILKQTVLENPY